MLISLVIPIYNVAPYIGQCLRSVFAQTYEGEVECLLVDDCGTDESMDIAERMLGKYHGPITFRILHHTHNRGLSAARNTGVAAAKGDYVCFMDSDDWATPDMLLRLATALQGAGPDVAIVAGFFYHNLTGTEFVENPFDAYCGQDFIIEPQDFALYQLDLRVPHEAWGRLIRRDLLTEVSFREGRRIEDRLWVLDATAVMERRSLKMLMIKDYIYYYRRREGSICHTDALRMLREDLEVCREVMKVMHDTHPAVWTAERRRYLWMLSTTVKEAAIRPGAGRSLLRFYPELLQTRDKEARRLLPPGVMVLYRKMKYQALLVWAKHVLQRRLTSNPRK